MNPRKAKELLPVLSTELDLPLEFLEDLTDSFWNHTHKLLVSLDHYHVMVPHLGTLHIKGSILLERTIAKLEKSNAWARVHKPKTTQRYARFMDTENKIAKLHKLKDQYFNELKLKRENRALRKQIRIKNNTWKDAKTDLGEPQANP